MLAHLGWEIRKLDSLGVDDRPAGIKSAGNAVELEVCQCELKVGVHVEQMETWDEAGLALAHQQGMVCFSSPLTG